MAVQYAGKKAHILSVLVEEAKLGRTITYGQLGKRIGIPAMGPWKGVLDELGSDETGAGRPDITYLVVKSSTGYPGQIGFEASSTPTSAQRLHADKVIADVWAFYRGRP